MSQVGAFPGMDWRRRTIRGPINPLDKSTIVSIYPKEINERKATIQPGQFIIAPGTVEKPKILVVGPSSWWRDIDEDQPLLEIPVSSIQIADSVVRDYCNGILACDMGESMPGLFYVPGAKLDAKQQPDNQATLAWIQKEYATEFTKAERRQKNWFAILIKMADSLWARSNGNPLAISEDMRMAAREMNLTDTKDWMKNFQMVDMVRCKACGSLKNPQYPICASCHFPDPDHPMTKQLMEMKKQMPSQSQDIEMSAVDLVGGNVMDVAASLMNDSAKTVYTYAAQSPYLRISLQELRELFELNNIPVTQKTSAVVQINAGITTIVYNAAGTPVAPKLPDDMVEPAQLWERARGINPFVPMTKQDYLPHNVEGVLTSQFIFYTWNSQQIEVLPANQNNDIKIDYIRQLFPDAGATIDQNTIINVINAQTFLEYRTASLLAEFIERNQTSAQALGAYAVLALDRATGIGVKGKQNIMTRRRPFRAGYKKRGWMTQESILIKSMEVRG